jgi:SAM-dependent methyltransferase
MPPDNQLSELLARWRDDLAAWAIPEPILAGVSESPWVLPTRVFARRSDRLSAQPSGPSFERAFAALEPAGTVLDIGAGAGAGSLPLRQRLTGLTAVDSSQAMLDLLADRARAAGVPTACVLGTWPAVAGEVPVADVVTCHHVTYNVPDLLPFLTAMTAHARRLVVVEMTMVHPLTSLSPLWLKFHGLARPQSPTSDDVLAILAAAGVEFGSRAWRRPGGSDYPSMAELTDITRRRLCLPPERADEVTAALVEAGVDPVRPQDLASSGRDVVTIWWGGAAAVPDFAALAAAAVPDFAALAAAESIPDGPADLEDAASCCRDDETA